jgi:hypothetical protein
MLSRIVFFTAVWSMLLLPLTLLVYFWWKARNDQDEADGLQAARWIGLACCAAPVLHMVLALTRSDHASSLSVYINVFLPVMTILTGTVAMCLLAGNAKVPECITGPIACVIAGLLSVVLFFGGMAAA